MHMEAEARRGTPARAIALRGGGRIRRPVRTALTATALLAAGSVGISAYVGWKMTHPVHRFGEITPADAGLAYEEVAFPSARDGVTLRGWFMPAEGTRTVILAHGYAMHRMGDSAALPLATLLVQHGYNVLAFDFRGHGRSEGRLVSLGFHEKYDILGAIAYLQGRFAPRRPAIGLLGLSMGAAIALEALALAPDDIQAVVSDSAYSDLQGYLQEHVSTWSHLPRIPFDWLIVQVAQVLTRVRVREVSGLRALRQAPDVPVLFIAGTADLLIPHEHTVQLHRASGAGEDRLWLVPDAGHVQAFDTQPGPYGERILAFFDQHLRA